MQFYLTPQQLQCGSQNISINVVKRRKWLRCGIIIGNEAAQMCDLMYTLHKTGHTSQDWTEIILRIYVCII